MARLSTQVAASPEQVWAVLRNGYSYHRWVPGTQNVRDVEDGWPAEGTSLHYTAGIGPLRQRDRTTVQRVHPGHLLELEAHAWPLGTARISISVEPAPTGSRIRLDEHPRQGLGGLLHNPLIDGFLWLRGKLMLRRLGRLAERAHPERV